MTLCFFTSCKPTPEDDIVITHSQKEFEEAIMMKAENIDKIECPSYYLDEFMSKDNKVTISFDAEVIIPEVTKFPVIKINPSPISKEMTKWAIDEFMEGNEGYYASMSLNKEEIEDWILRLQADLAEEDVENAKDILSSKIDAYKQMLIDASVDEPQIPTNLVFRPFSFYVNYDYQSKETELNMTSEELTERENNEDLNLYLQSDVELSNGLYARLTIYNEFPFSLNNRNVESVFGMEMYQIHIVYSYIPLSTDKTYILEPEPFGYLAPSGSLDSRYPDIIISEQEALEIAQKKLADMGIEDYYIEYCESRMGNEDIYNYRNYKSDLEGNLISFERYVDEEDIKNKFYLMIIKPKYYGIPLLEANQAFYNEDLYSSPIAYESIKIRLSNDSIAEFKWTNPTDVSNVINDNVQIISFDEAIKNASNFMRLKYNLPTLMPLYPSMSGYDDLLEKYTDAQITITEIKLGLAGVPAYDSSDEYLLIPVWNFYGSYNLNAIEDGYCIKEENAYFPLISVNAIDGSIIMQEATIIY